MNKDKILFISTNNIWGGSEVLWTCAAKELLKRGYTVNAATQYNTELLKQLITAPGKWISLAHKIQHPPLFYRLLRKLKIAKFPAKDLLHVFLKKEKPGLVIISQGNNMDGLSFMKDCVQFRIPFVTIIHLTTEAHWPSLNDAIINELNSLYAKSVKNYFVSGNTMLLHEKMLGMHFENNKIIYNPFTGQLPPAAVFPAAGSETGMYKVALAGRLELFHKGYDLLVDVLKNEKWKNRNIHFSLFGKGPHAQLLQRLIDDNNILNFTIHPHVEDIGEIWKTHHLLLMPSRMEGQSLSLIEAMNFNRTAVVTDVGGTNELIEDGVNGFIAKAPTAYYIDEALERAWQRRSEWEQLGINAAKSIAVKHPPNPVACFAGEIETLLRQ